MRKIKVKFEDYGQQYSYLTDDYTIKSGDQCVVKSPTGVKLVTVTQVDVKDDKATKPIVCKVDLKTYEQTVAKLAKQTELTTKIELRVKALINGELRKSLAKKDPELAELLHQLESI